MIEFIIEIINDFYIAFAVSAWYIGSVIGCLAVIAFTVDAINSERVSVKIHNDSK